MLTIPTDSHSASQQPPSFTSPCRCGHKAPSHILYDTIIVLLFTEAEEAIPPIPSGPVLLLPGRDVWTPDFHYRGSQVASKEY